MNEIRRTFPYTVFPEDLLKNVGAMTIAYQMVESEVRDLLEDLQAEYAEFDQQSVRDRRSISARITLIKKLAKALLSEDKDQLNRVQELLSKLAQVGNERNRFLHSCNHMSDKQTCNVFQYDRPSDSLNEYSEDSLNKMTNQMLLLIDALVNRRMGVECWYASLEHWETRRRIGNLEGRLGLRISVASFWSITAGTTLPARAGTRASQATWTPRSQSRGQLAPILPPSKR